MEKSNNNQVKNINLKIKNNKDIEIDSIFSSIHVNNFVLISKFIIRLTIFDFNFRIKTE